MENNNDKKKIQNMMLAGNITKDAVKVFETNIVSEENYLEKAKRK